MKNKFRARTHWPLCLATGGRVFVADPSTLGRHVGEKPNGKNNPIKCPSKCVKIRR